MSKIAVFPGSFDPITIGHVDIIERASGLFDQVIIGIGNNSQKKYLFPIEKRIEWIEELYKDNEKISTGSYSGLTIDFCKENNAQYIIRGLRSVSDLEFERPVAQMNLNMSGTIETIFLVCSPEHSGISSTIVRELVKYGADVSSYVPSMVKPGD